MGKFMNDPVGWKTNSDPGGAGGSPLFYGPGGGMGMYDPNPGGGYMKDPRTNM
ncbi:TPA: hypothetical protein ACJMKJ_004858 [Bacillus wiedmannii]